MSLLDEKETPLLADDKPVEPPLSRQRKRSILVSLITMFLGSVMFSITLPSMAYFYDIVECKTIVELEDGGVAYEGESLGFYGFIVAIFSIGQAVSSPPFGKWYNHRSAKGPYICGLIFLIGGSILYFFSYNREMLLVARLLVGIGSGTATVCRSHVANAVPVEKRTGAMALVAASQAVGFIIGPAFALIFSSVNIELSEFLYFDEFTAPGLSSAGFGVLNLILVLAFFKEDSVELRNKAVAASAEINKTSLNDGPSDEMADDAPLMVSASAIPYDHLAIMLNMVIFFFVTTGFSVFEAIGTPFTAYNLGWTVEQNSIFFTAAGCASIVSFILVKPLASRVGDRWTLVVGLTLMTAGLCGRMCSGGSDCHISEIQYWLTTFLLYTIGFPISNAVCFGIFSKIMGPAPQGTMTGWQMLVGSVARTVGPIWASSLFSLDPTGRAVFGVTASGCFLCVILVFVYWKRFVPWGDGPGSEDYDRSLLDMGGKKQEDFAGGH